MSNRYRRIDNLDIASIVLPVLQDMEGMHFESCQLTESRMYIKVVNTRLEAEVVPGDIVQSGIIISNSEVLTTLIYMRLSVSWQLSNGSKRCPDAPQPCGPRQ